MKSTVILPSIYLPTEENVFMENQSLFSLDFGGGFRLQFDNVAIALEAQFHKFSSDRVEGLDSDSPGDKYDDTQVNINLGVMFNMD